jgi:hypothetical protein
MPRGKAKCNRPLGAGSGDRCYLGQGHRGPCKPKRRVDVVNAKRRQQYRAAVEFQGGTVRGYSHERDWLVPRPATFAPLDSFCWEAEQCAERRIFCGHHMG